MDRKDVRKQASGTSSANGEKSKESALEKLRQMEWRRNAQDSHHLARPSARSNEFHEKKKYNKDEDNYFEGTGVTKTKKSRRPKTTEEPPAAVTAFTTTDFKCGPPPLNAWTKKKGSALFQKEDDPEELAMKHVLEESLKTLEEDKRRREERYSMTNLEVPTSTHGMYSERHWRDEDSKDIEDEYNNDAFSKPDPSEYQEDPKPSNLHFVGTEIKNKPTSQRHMPIPSEARTSPPQKPTSTFAIKRSSSPKSNKNVPISKVDFRAKESYESDSNCEESETDDGFEYSRPQTKYENNIKVKESLSVPTSKSIANTTVFNETAEKVDSAMVNNLAINLKSNFNLDETNNSFENKKANEDFNNYKTLRDTSAEKSDIDPSKISETDIFLHTYFKFSPQTPQASEVIQTAESNNFFSLPTPLDQTSDKYYLPYTRANTELPVTNSLVSNSLPGSFQLNGQDSTSQTSSSPLLTPYGSLDNEVTTNARTGGQGTPQLGYPYPYSIDSQESLRRQLEAMLYMNQNLASTFNLVNSISAPNLQMPQPQAAMTPPQSAIPQPQTAMTQPQTAMPLPHTAMPQPRPAMPQPQTATPQPQAPMPVMGQSPYCLPTPNMMVPGFHPSSVLPSLYQHPLQQMHLQQLQMSQGYLPQMMKADSTQIEQSQSSSGGNKPENENVLQAQLLQAQALALAQSQLLTQAKAQVPVMQNDFQQNQSQSISENAFPKLGLQQTGLEDHAPQNVGKSKEELLIIRQNMLQALRQVEEQMQDASSVQAAQPQPMWGVPSPAAVPMSINHFFPSGVSPPQLQQYLPQTTSSGLISPIHHNLLGTNLGQDETQTSVGRGQGRL